MNHLSQSHAPIPVGGRKPWIVSGTLAIVLFVVAGLGLLQVSGSPPWNASSNDPAPEDKPDKLQPSKNLLNNSSFEKALSADGLPEEWSRWVQEDGKYRFEVVEGGRTDKKCLKIEGAGIHAVVFANSVKIERNKRYVLRGWVKFEGARDAVALIKFNYFHEGKWLGLPDVVGVTSKQKGWHFLAKTDLTSKVPDASTISVSCNLEGKGTAWFDDLELVAYDAKNLPDDFDTRFGPSNRLPEFDVLQQRIGTWDTETTTKPGVWVPDGRKSRGVETIKWVLGNKFIQAWHRSQPGDVEAMSLVTYDDKSGVFRAWYFDSNGSHPRGEATGQWDNAEKTLTFKTTNPEQVTNTAIFRSVTPDRIDLQAVWRDKDGRVLMEIEGKRIRHK